MRVVQEGDRFLGTDCGKQRYSCESYQGGGVEDLAEAEECDRGAKFSGIDPVLPVGSSRTSQALRLLSQT